MTSAEAEMLAFGLAFLVQGAGIVWWAATVNSRVKSSEDDVTKLSGRVSNHDKRLEEAATLSARLDERSTSLVTTLNRIADKLGVS